MCQAYESEARAVLSVELQYGTFQAALAGKKPLKDYCVRCDNYWCGCTPRMVRRQTDSAISAKRRKRQRSGGR